MIMWLVMRGALSAQVKKVHQTYYLPTMTGLATAIYEDQAVAVSVEIHEKYRQRIQQQTAGVENLSGTYPFTLARSVKAYRVNKFLHRLIEPDFRARFLADFDSLAKEHRLTEEEADLIRRFDWRGLIHYGAIFFVLEKMGAVVGVSNLHLYAAMRGESLKEFLQTRNAPGALYSVAAKPKPE